MRTSFVLTLFALAWLVGMISAWVGRDRGEPRVRLLNKPKKTPLSVLVPPGPAPRLIPSDSPNATHLIDAPGSRKRPAGGPGYRVLDYLAAFSDSAKGRRVDYLLVSSDDVGESPDPPAT